MNGNLVYHATFPVDAETDLGSNNYIGCYQGNNNFFSGAIENIKFFNNILSEAEVKSLYFSENCNFEYEKNRTRQLIACYPFNANTNDAVSNNNGTEYNVTLTTDRTNSLNKAYQFSGSNSFISLPDTTIPKQMVEYTVSAWVNVNTLPAPNSFSTIFSMGGGTQLQNIMINSSGNIVFQSSGQNYVGITPLISSNSITSNSWKLITVVRSANADIIYLDGQLVAEQEHIATVDYSNHPKIRIGSDVNNLNFFSGKIDDVKIFKGALFADEVNTLFQSINCQFNLCPPLLTITNPTNSPSISGASKQLNSSSKLNSLPVEYSSGKSIILNPGFETSNGNFFKAQISGCPK